MLSGIQHYYFCKKQWALIHMNQEWAESADTMQGQIVHKKVDDPFIKEKRGTVFYSRALPLSSKTLGLSGIADLVEFHKDEKGIEVFGKKGKWKPIIVEYKKGKKRKDLENELQLTAQVICLEEYFNIEINKSYIYQFETKTREEIIIDQSLRKKAYQITEEMHTVYESRKIPNVEQSKKCYRCSLKDICMPSLKKDFNSIENYLRSSVNDEETA